MGQKGEMKQVPHRGLTNSQSWSYGRPAPRICMYINTL